MSAGLKRTELTVGARVHHRGGIYSRGWTPAQQAAKPDPYWGTVVEIHPRVYGAEYLVRRDRAWPGGEESSWWASYHLDAWEVPS